MNYVATLKRLRRSASNPTCGICHRFMSWRDVGGNSVEWTPFGGPLDVDPPSEEYAHLSCWQDAPLNVTALITRISWIGPSFHRNKAASDA